MKVCLVGNPNCGKTTLFNLLTGLQQKVGNYSGVTVDKHYGKITVENQTIELIDLPGTHSLFPRAKDEIIVFNTLLNKELDSYPDAILLVTNASQLRRNLVLVQQTLDLGIPAMVAVNMIDEAEEEFSVKQKNSLEQELGVPVHLISARKNIGINHLKSSFLNGFKIPKVQNVTLEEPFHSLLVKVSEITGSNNSFENLLQATLTEKSTALTTQQKEEILTLRKEMNVSGVNLMAKDINQRFSKANQIIKQLYDQPKKAESSSKKESKLDKILTHKYLGIPIALTILFLVFQSIFTLATPFMDQIERIFGWLGDKASALIPEGWLNDLVVNGVIAGLGGVLVFIPQIAFLFTLISILESTGYMARISFMFDKLMRKFGLSGKSLVPMMSGFACAIPAIMATRTNPNWKERLISILVIPLMSCTARLPVYVLLIGMFIPNKKIAGIFGLQGLTMMGFYLLGLALALIISLILHKTLKTEGQAHYIMELPRYRMPQWRNIFLSVYQKVKVFVLEAGKVILFISILLWFLASYGPGQKMQQVEQKYEEIQANGELSEEQAFAYNQEKLVNSYAGHIGKAIEPAIKPLGFDWKIGISLLTSFAAREVFVGTMATIYSVGEENTTSLQEKLLREKDPKTGKPIYSIATVFSLLMFFAIAMQCMSTLAVVKSETKSWKWPVIQFIYLTILAYGLSFITYQVLS